MIGFGQVPGCTDTLACNYDSLATVDDGSCILPDGCTDSTAFNYNSLAICDDESCIPFVYGCTDTNAINYDSTANTNMMTTFGGPVDNMTAPGAYSQYNGYLNLDDNVPGLGLTVTDKYKSDFKIIE